MSRRILLTLISIYLLPVHRADSAEVALKPNDFFVAPITTDVHRAVISNQATTYAMVNCNAFFPGTNSEPSALDLTAFENQLKKFASAQPSQLKLVLRYQLDLKTGKPARKTVETRLKKAARTAGYHTVSSTEIFTSAKWDDVLSGARNFEEKEDAQEPIVQDELIKAYPVRTKLSRFAVGNVDCVVEIKRPFDGRQKELSDALQFSIRKAVKLLRLGEEKGKLFYQVSSTTAGHDLIDKLFNPRQPPVVAANVKDPEIIKLLVGQQGNYKPSPGLKFALDLGFDSIGCQHSPCGGAPEKLVGQPAPDFSLETLEGKKLELRSYIKGRPALVSFWGVACGPCRREAPHLTKMHEKYGDRFAIVAVNGYDETKGVVSKFAEKAKLTHPIALNGGAVAGKLYHVGAYPTTFWINRDGIVADYEIDFDSPAALERRILEMLEGK